MNPVYAATAVAIAAIAALAIVHQDPNAPAAKVAAAAPQEEPAAPKADLEPAFSHPVRTVSIPQVELTPMQVVAAPEQQAISAAIRPETRRATKTENPRKIATGDVCARHGREREDYIRSNGWHGWRCIPKRGAR